MAIKRSGKRLNMEAAHLKLLFFEDSGVQTCLSWKEDGASAVSRSVQMVLSADPPVRPNASRSLAEEINWTRPITIEYFKEYFRKRKTYCRYHRLP